MIDSTNHRGGPGDRRTAWAGICVSFPDLRNRADQYGYGQRLAKLVDQVKRGDRNIADWHQLLGELAELAIDEEDVTWRNDRQRASDAWPSPLDPTGDGYSCPGGLCSRRAAPSFGASPTCELLSLAMDDLGLDG
jgi:hypothetical protein